MTLSGTDTWTVSDQNRFPYRDKALRSSRTFLVFSVAKKELFTHIFLCKESEFDWIRTHNFGPADDAICEGYTTRSLW